MGSPVFLTRNGRGRYVVMDMREYEETHARLRLLAALVKGEKAGQEHGWLDINELEASLGVKMADLKISKVRVCTGD